MALNFVQSQAFTLAGAGNAIGATTLVIQDFNDLNGVALTMADFGTLGYGTCEPNSSNEEQISWTGITVNGDGTSTLTGVSTVLTYTPYTKTSGLTKQHSGGTKFVVSNTAGFYNEIAVKQNDEVVTGAWRFPNNASTPILGTSYVAPTIAWQVASKGYVDSVAVSGAPNADTTTKGIVEIATGAELAAGTGTGGTGAAVVPAGSSFTNTSAGAGDVNKVPVLNASGQLAAGFIADASTTVAGKAELATGAETAAGTATGGAGPLVPANSSFTATSSGAADANKVAVLGSAGVIADGFGYTTVTAGETVTAGQGAYAKAADSRAWKSQGTTDEATFNFIGVFADAGNAGDTVRLVPPGGVLTTTGLTAGAYYFVSDTAGTLATTPGTRFARVGLALSTTRLLVLVPKYRASGSQSITSATTFVQTTGFYPGNITIRAASVSQAITGMSVGGDDNTCVRFAYSSGDGRNVYFAWSCGTGSAPTTVNNEGTVSAKSATGFTLSCSTYTATVRVNWVAESL